MVHKTRITFCGKFDNYIKAAVICPNITYGQHDIWFNIKLNLKAR